MAAPPVSAAWGSSTTNSACPGGYCAASETMAIDNSETERSADWPTTNRWLPLWRWNTASVGPLIELGAPSQAQAASGRVAGRVRSPAASSALSRTSAGALPSKMIGGGGMVAAVRGARGDLVQNDVALVLGQPDDLERAVSRQRAGLVVVDPLARPGEQARRGIVIIHDQVGVGLVALQRDADDHLAERGAGQRVGAAERLRTENHVDAEGPALAHDAV